MKVVDRRHWEKMRALYGKVENIFPYKKEKKEKNCIRISHGRDFFYYFCNKTIVFVRLPEALLHVVTNSYCILYTVHACE